MIITVSDVLGIIMRYVYMTVGMIAVLSYGVMWCADISSMNRDIAGAARHMHCRCKHVEHNGVLYLVTNWGKATEHVDVHGNRTLSQAHVDLDNSMWHGSSIWEYVVAENNSWYLRRTVKGNHGHEIQSYNQSHWFDMKESHEQWTPLGKFAVASAVAGAAFGLMYAYTQRDAIKKWLGYKTEDDRRKSEQIKELHA